MRAAAILLSLLPLACVQTRYVPVPVVVPQGADALTETSSVGTGLEPQELVLAEPPPEILYEEVPFQPHIDWVWIPGYWDWLHGGWVWISGYWGPPPFAGYIYIGPRYVVVDGRCHYHRGHWRPRHHAPPRTGRRGGEVTMGREPPARPSPSARPGASKPWSAPKLRSRGPVAPTAREASRLPAPETRRPERLGVRERGASTARESNKPATWTPRVTAGKSPGERLDARNRAATRPPPPRAIPPRAKPRVLPGTRPGRVMAPGVPSPIPGQGRRLPAVPIPGQPQASQGQPQQAPAAPSPGKRSRARLRPLPVLPTPAPPPK